MDLAYTAEYEAYRGKVRDFLATQWHPLPKAGDKEAAKANRAAEGIFRTTATDAGYLYRSVPRQFGGSEQPADLLKAQIIREEFEAARAPTEIPGIGVQMLVPTLLDVAADWQKELFIPKTLSGEYLWAQGYSEPGSGSDLASVRTRAELQGDSWVINGQKLWSTRAQYCRFMFALVRTEPDAPKHQGLSYILLDLKAAGVTVRPLKQMTGWSEFCEVFFDNVKTPASWIVGERGAGWTVSRSTLKHERSYIGASSKTQKMFDGLLKLARSSKRDGSPAIADPRVRQSLAKLAGTIEAQRYSSYRQISMAARGQDPGLIGLLGKLLSTNIGHEAASIARDLIGDDLLLAPPAEGAWGKAGNEKWNNQFMGSLGVAIAGGTSNIQRNIIAERGLGLPRDTKLAGASA